ncbi:MAG: glycerol-3-phosphate acyltransferase [Candidatus Cloacimonetes bacterium]|nr:glycerol-3-phosphate acyltransferase [Candidatus Cloacimonadota bacterium]
MFEFFIPVLLIIVSYLIGCFSSARVIARTFRNLRIEKIGSGHPDTTNIYLNVSKALGLLTGAIDFTMMYLYLFLLQRIFSNTFPLYANQIWLLIFGFMMIVGHCLPVTNKFRGGRGVITYTGFIAFFAPTAMGFAVLPALIVVFFFRQTRFAKFLIVLLLPISCQILSTFFEGQFQNCTPDFVTKLLIGAFLMAILNLIVAKRLGEI